MQKTIFILLFFFVVVNSYAQTTTFTQTYIDRCTGNVQVVTANFVNGSATVAFYSKVRTFTHQEFLNGTLHAWLGETYAWWNALSPCSTATTQAQQAQQTAQQATSAATAATSAATAATQNTTSNVTQNTTTSNNTANNTNQSTTSGGTTGSSQSNDNSGSTGTQGTNESSSETSKSSEGSSGGQEKSEESKTSESSGSEEEGGTKENNDDDSGDGEKSEEKVEEKKKEEKKKEEKKEKKRRELLPIQLRADMMSNQSLLGSYDVVMSMGATQSSLFGDETYGLTGMVWSNLRQFSINGSYTKVHMEKFNVSTLNHDGHTHYSKTKDVSVKDPITPPTPKLKSITSLGVSYMNNFGSGAVILSANKLKPMGKWGTAGFGLTATNLFYEGSYQQTLIGYNVLYTNMVNVTPRIQYTPALIWTQTPYSSKIGYKSSPNTFGETFNLRNELSGTKIGGIVILSNSFTIRLTRRFTFNTGWTVIKFTDPLIPIINSFMIGAKLPF